MLTATATTARPPTRCRFRLWNAAEERRRDEGRRGLMVAAGGRRLGEVVSRSDVDCMAGDAAATTMTKRSGGRSVSDVVHCNAATV